LIAKGPEIISKFANIINDNFPTILLKGVQLLGQLALGIIQAIPTLVANIPKIITAIVDVWEAFNWVNLGKKAITFLKDGVLKMVGAVKSAGTSVMNGVTNAIKSLPDKLFSLGKNSMSKMVSAIKNAVGSVKSGATSVINGVVNTFKTLPSKLVSIGKDLVRGLANGISDMAGWVINKIKGFSDKILGGIKSFFGVNSPSKETAWIGQMLDEGLVKGVEDYADRPLKAMADLSQGMLDEADEVNGVTLNRQLNTTFRAEPALSTAETGIMTALDSILEAVKNGHILAIDGEALVGATLSTLDAKLGRKRLLAARGAL
jgi:phage-related protein